MYGYFLTNQGKVRKTNEDAGGVFYNDSNQLLAIVADGMGGHKAGEVASKMATSIVEECWKKSEEFTSPDATENWLKERIEEANESIFHYSQENSEYEGMGTTVVISICTSDFITVAHIGDSRCYILNDNGFKQLTEDHSLVNELVRTGQISEGDAEQHPRKNVLLRALGTEEEIKVDIQSISWEKENKLLLSSDGLTNKFLHDELEQFLSVEETITDISKSFIDTANERGGEDNITLAIVVNELLPEVGEQ